MQKCVFWSFLVGFLISVQTYGHILYLRTRAIAPILLSRGNLPNEYTLSFRTVSAYGAATLPLDLLSILLISLLFISTAHATRHHYSINCPSSLADETIPTTTSTSFAISTHQPCNARYVPTRL